MCKLLQIMIPTPLMVNDNNNNDINIDMEVIIPPQQEESELTTLSNFLSLSTATENYDNINNDTTYISDTDMSPISDLNGVTIQNSNMSDNNIIDLSLDDDDDDDIDDDSSVDSEVYITGEINGTDPVPSTTSISTTSTVTTSTVNSSTLTFVPESRPTQTIDLSNNDSEFGLMQRLSPSYHITTLPDM